VTAAGVQELRSSTAAPSLRIEWYSMEDHSEDWQQCHCEVHKVTYGIVALHEQYLSTRFKAFSSGLPAVLPAGSTDGQQPHSNRTSS
jgi:hypothetical protein